MPMPTWDTDAGPIEAGAAITAARRAYGVRQVEVCRVTADGDTWDVYAPIPGYPGKARWLGVLRGRPTHKNARTMPRKKV